MALIAAAAMVVAALFRTAEPPRSLIVHGVDHPEPQREVVLNRVYAYGHPAPRDE